MNKSLYIVDELQRTNPHCQRNLIQLEFPKSIAQHKLQKKITKTYTYD